MIPYDGEFLIKDSGHYIVYSDRLKLKSLVSLPGYEVVFEFVSDPTKSNSEMNNLVKGFMFESFIKGGSQKIDDLMAETVDRGGLSITDPCLSWEQTENLLKEIAAGL